MKTGVFVFMDRYVLGFLFDESTVSLIKKNKPERQKNLLNGIGGKCKEEELPEDAIVREFQEETGIYINDWTYFAQIVHNDNVIWCYKAFGNFYNIKLLQMKKLDGII